MIACTIVLALRGVARTSATAAGGEAGPLIGPRVRAWYRGVLAPLEDVLVGWGIHADTLTWAQLAISVMAGAAFAMGAMFLAGWLTILAGTLDVLDGGVARRAGIAGPRGAFVDSVVDRWAEFATFAGLGAFFRDGWVLGAVALAAFGSFMVSYTRARAEALGLDLQMGSAQRPERYLILGAGAWLSALVVHLGCGLGYRTGHGILVTAVVVLALLSMGTAVQRTRHAMRALGRGMTS